MNSVTTKRISAVNPSVYEVGAAGFWLRQIAVSREGKRPYLKLNEQERRAFWKQRDRIHRLGNLVSLQN